MIIFWIGSIVGAFLLGVVVEKHRREDNDAKLRAEISRLGRYLAEGMKP